jgi:hypothetical protein
MKLYQNKAVLYEDMNMSKANSLPRLMSVNQAFWPVVIASALTAILYVVPFLSPIAYPFLLLSTLVHEMGHGLAALIVGGHFESFQMWIDGSGVANINGNFGPYSRAFIAAAGLLGPSVVSLLFFLNMKTPLRSRMMLSVFGIVLVMSILFVVRNWFGIIFVAVVASSCFYFSLGAQKKYSQTVLAFFASQLALSVFSRSDYLFTDKAITSAGLMPSDVAQIADALFLPYWFWGVVCGLFSVGILVFGIKRIFN